MKRTDKDLFIEDFRERVGKASVVYLTDFTGLSVKSMTVLRQRLRESGAEYVVVKNRIALRALRDAHFPDLADALKGPTGVVLGGGEITEAAKTLTTFAKEHGDRPVFKGGVLDGNVLTPANIQRLATLPSREQLLSELAGALQAPMAALASVLQAKLQETAGLLEALREQRSES
jgi:large subunit ribosomal protein L10